MPVFDRLWNFVRRHKKKLIVLGVVVGGVAFLKRYYQHKWQDWEESTMAECVDRMKHEQHFESTRHTCRTTIVGMLPSLKERLVFLHDCEAITEKLQDRPANRVQLWEKLRCTSFALLVTEVYGGSLLVTMLNVQLNVIGGYMFVDAMAPSKLSASTCTAVHPRLSHAVQQKYLALVQWFLVSGVERLSAVVCSAVSRNVGAISLKESLAFDRIQELLNSIRHSVEELVDPSGLGLFRFVLPPEEENLAFAGSWAPGDDVMYARILRETRDLLESQECEKVLLSCVDGGFSVVADAMMGYFVNPCPENVPPESFTNPNDVSLPLAKVIPIVTALSRRLFTDLSDQFVSSVFALNTQQIMGANIYETFSQPLNGLSNLRNQNFL